ncbi:Methionine vitamin-b12 [Mycena indigotica]|uniref:Methionine vitamin-b12 n=1 Tax=Mycena indigotica TaxID=2126181 RepID=A0A8H6SZS8_9AGAR|nr:Methionine vitamin-b12 [Mycena indigotica]KAF7306865.1 Methionine vitamin-b12 [Mycena indigotica]
MAMKQQSSFRVDHVGSFIRPEPLLTLRTLIDQGRICSRDLLKETEDAAVAHVVQLQQEETLLYRIPSADVSTEKYTMRQAARADPHASSKSLKGVFDKLEGITNQPHRAITEFKSYWPHVQILRGMGFTEYPSCFCSGKIKRTVPFYVDQFKALMDVVPPEVVRRLKVNMCPPTWFHQFHGSDLTYDKSIYSNDNEYFDDLAVAYRAEIRELYALGCRNIQFDDPTFCFLCNEGTLRDMQLVGDDSQALLDTYIRAINLCTKGRPQDLTIGLHMCRGNFMGGVHFTEGSYELIAKKVFQQLDVDTFYLEYDDARSGSFLPLRYVPINRTVVLGIVTTKRAQASCFLEDPELLKARVYQAAQVLSNGFPRRTMEVALNQLCIRLTAAFSFTSTTPSQCDDLHITWTGGSGSGYRLHIIPVFGVPLNLSIPDAAYNAANKSGSFTTQLQANASDRIVLTMSDNTGFGAGGASQLYSVGKSLGGNCDLKEQPLGFVFGLDPTPTQCQTSTFSRYLENRAVPPVRIFGVIPSGTSFQLEPGTASTFKWKANVFNSTSLIFFMVDANQNQGGSELFNIGLSGDTSCITSDSPSTTTPDASQQTSSPSPSHVTHTGSSPIGAIAGSVLGALVFLAVLITLGLFFLRQWQEKKRPAGGMEFRRSSRPMDSDFDLTADSRLVPHSPAPSPYTTSSPPAHYQAHSQYFSQPTTDGTNPFGASSVSLHAAPPSVNVDPFMDQSSEGSAPNTSRKSGMSSYKPSRYIMHTDSEDYEPPANADGVVELPPSYSATRAPAKGLPPS